MKVLWNKKPYNQRNAIPFFRGSVSYKNKTNVVFSLPTEAQWEYAARSGGKNEIYSGSNNASQVAWYFGNSENKTHKVGTKFANGLGIYDMSGNLREWCKDMYAKDAYSDHSIHNPMYVVSADFLSYEEDRFVPLLRPSLKIMVKKRLARGSERFLKQFNRILATIHPSRQTAGNQIAEIRV